MDITTTVDTAMWEDAITRARQELEALPGFRRAWLAARVKRIGALQSELERLFAAAGGPAICASCLGGCCSRAKHHLTLTNILAYLVAGEEPPKADFTRPCPMLGAHGCQLAAERRPFNCIIFLCDAVDRKLSAAQRTAFAGIEAELRTLYRAVADRCPGASLHGLLIATLRRGPQPLLTHV